MTQFWKGSTHIHLFFFDWSDYGGISLVCFGNVLALIWDEVFFFFVFYVLYDRIVLYLVFKTLFAHLWDFGVWSDLSCLFHRQCVAFIRDNDFFALFMIIFSFWKFRIVLLAHLLDFGVCSDLSCLFDRQCVDSDLRRRFFSRN